MIVRTLEDCKKGKRRVATNDFESIRMLLQDDNMGFSFHITTIFAGQEIPIHYKYHLESVYCISGKGEVETLDDGKVHNIEPGTIYILDKHDKHILRAYPEADLVFACVFNPPLTGNEVHDADGAYPPAGS